MLTNLKLMLRGGIGAALLVLLLIAIFQIRSCMRPSTVVVKNNPALMSQELPDNAQLEVNVTHSRVIEVKSRVGNDVHERSEYVPQDGKAQVTLLTNGQTVINVKNKGFSFVPGMGVQFTDRPRIAGDVQVFYWNRWEAYIGGAFPVPVAHIGLGYRLDQIKYLANTSLCVVYTTRRNVGAELRVRF